LQPTGDFIEQPSATTILGAAKITGKTRRGWSVGVLDAVTDREMAHTASGATFERTAIEPRTNYFVARMQHEIGRRAGIGMILTSVTR
jgi:hypothetical protein